MKAVQTEEAIIQNLKDAGCDRETIERFLEDYRKGAETSGIKQLGVHRRKLLDSLHDDQKRIDCLDYLLWQIQRERNDGS